MHPIIQLTHLLVFVVPVHDEVVPGLRDAGRLDAQYEDGEGGGVAEHEEAQLDLVARSERKIGS